MKFTVGSAQDQRVLDMVQFYAHNREDGSTVRVERDPATSVTGTMSMKDAREYGGPFGGMVKVTCERRPGIRVEHALVAQNGEVLHL